MSRVNTPRWSNNEQRDLPSFSQESARLDVIVPDTAQASDSSVGGTHLLALLCCDWATATDDGRYVLGGIFDYTSAVEAGPESPPVTQPFYVYVRLGGMRPGHLRIAILAPDQRTVFAVDGEIDLAEGVAAPFSAFDLLVSRITVAAHLEGTYWIEVRFDDRVLGRSPLAIRVQKKEAPDANSIRRELSSATTVDDQAP